MFNSLALLSVGHCPVFSISLNIQPLFKLFLALFCCSSMVLLVCCYFCVYCNLILLPYKFKPPCLIYCFSSFQSLSCPGWGERKKEEEGGGLRSVVHPSDLILGLNLFLVVFTPVSHFSPSPLICFFCVEPRFYTGFGFLPFPIFS